MNNKSITILLATITAFQGLTLLSELINTKSTVAKNKAQKWFEAECEEFAKYSLTHSAHTNYTWTSARDLHAPLCQKIIDKYPEWMMKYVK